MSMSTSSGTTSASTKLNKKPHPGRKLVPALQQRRKRRRPSSRLWLPVPLLMRKRQFLRKVRKTIVCLQLPLRRKHLPSLNHLWETKRPLLGLPKTPEPRRLSPPRRLLLCNNHGEPRRLHTRPPEEARQGLEALPYLRPLIATNIRHIRRDPIILLEALGEISPINRLREQEAKEPSLRHPATDGIPAFPGLRVSPGVPSGEEKPSAPCSYPSGLCFL